MTGMGAVTPLGLCAESSWEGLLAGRSGVGPITQFDPVGQTVTIAAEVSGFDPLEWIAPKAVRKLDRFVQLALAAAQMAMDDSGLEIVEANADDVAVYIGSGAGGIGSLGQGFRTLDRSGPRRFSPFLLPRMLVNMASGHVSILLGARGPNLSHVSACATGSHSIGEALRLIRHGYAKAAVAGGTEAAVLPITIAGFSRMRALSTRNHEPEKASRPFDRDRDGFVLGEAAGVVILEELEHAKARGARIYCELLGYGANSDAHHMTSPSPDGGGAANCMARTLRDARLDPSEIDYINAHGTGTPLNDVAEVTAIKTVFGSHANEVAVSSTKSMTGHLQGAAGAVEAIICALAIQRRTIPPTINLEHPDPACDLDFVPHAPREKPITTVVSNSFGFGGTNACLALGRLR